MSWSGGRDIPRRIRLKAEHYDTKMDLNGKLDGITLLKACHEDDPLALAVLEEMAHYLAVCVFNVYQLLNVNLFVFGGGLVHFGPMLFDRVRAEFDRYNHIPQPVFFRFAELKQDFGIIGAARFNDAVFVGIQPVVRVEEQSVDCRLRSPSKARSVIGFDGCEWG